MKKYSATGFAHLGLVVLAVVVLAVAGLSYKVVKDRNKVTQASNTPATSAPQVVPTIKSAADLNTAETTLNSQNVDGDLNPSSLDQDVQSLY